jgi:hypothetical protein
MAKTPKIEFSLDKEGPFFVLEGQDFYLDLLTTSLILLSILAKAFYLPSKSLITSKYYKVLRKT